MTYEEYRQYKHQQRLAKKQQREQSKPQAGKASDKEVLAQKEKPVSAPKDTSSQQKPAQKPSEKPTEKDVQYGDDQQFQHKKGKEPRQA